MNKLRSRDRRHLMGGIYEDEAVKGDFRCGMLFRSTFTDVVFYESEIAQADFSNSTFVRTSFRECDLSGTNFTICRFEDCSFIGCTMDLANFRTAYFKNCLMSEGRAEYTNFSDAIVDGMTFNLSLHGSDLRFSSSSGLVDFQDSNLWGCSITISCKTFLDVAISRRSLELLVGLLATTKGNDDLRETLDSTISEQYRKMLEALTLKES